MSRITFIDRREFRHYYGIYRWYLDQNVLETKMPEELTEDILDALRKILEIRWSTDPLDNRCIMNGQRTRLFRLKQAKIEGELGPVLNIVTKMDVSRLI